MHRILVRNNVLIPEYFTEHCLYIYITSIKQIFKYPAANMIILFRTKL